MSRVRNRYHQVDTFDRINSQRFARVVMRWW